jgi:hypothetical protein
VADAIVLVGLPELREILKRNVLQSLTGRIAIRVHLPPLDADQVKQYVRHRMSAAGCQRCEMEWRPGLTHDLWRTRKSHGPESIIEDVGVTNLHRTVTSHIGTPGSFRRIHIDEFGAYHLTT